MKDQDVPMSTLKEPYCFFNNMLKIEELMVRPRLVDNEKGVV